ncbi:MAG: glycerol-3-phosphate 1-O-acyltransferase PlsY [Deltaproteobacteria bacterium]|nr:glycerol-3-phosphate 1-O-acyltransferase PlsY [Deltaproteobacteria bacterium]
MNELLERPSPTAWLCALGFVAGSIPFGLILALVFGKTDIRKAGSGNIGATNVARVAGKKLGVVTLVLDALKGALPVLLTVDLMAADFSPRAVALAAALVGLCALLGHCFTPWLRFKGGKGVATGLGVLLALDPEIAGYAVVAFAVAFAASRLVSVSSLSAAVVVVIALLLRGPVDAAVVPIVLCLVVIGMRHIENVRRVFRRQELKL